MSVQSEITRLANAKTALATAIEGKGVTVPEGTKLDGMAALVEAIEAGGGGDFDFSSLGGVNFVKSGSFTPASDNDTVLIDDADFLTITPKLFVLYTESVQTATDFYVPLALVQAHITDDTGFILGVWTKTKTSFVSINPSNFKPFKFNTTSSASVSDAYLFSSSSVGTPCSMNFSGFTARASGFKPSSSSGSAKFEAGATYKYIYMGVKK